MSTTTQIVDEVMRELGITGNINRTRVESACNETVVDLLSQNEGRFKGLEKSTTISITTGEKFYKLPVDFNAMKATFYEIDDDDEFIAQCAVVAKSEVIRRKSESRYAGERIAYVERRTDQAAGPGYYLVLADDPDDDTSFVLDYFRIPTQYDTDLIRNPTIVKRGVKGMVGVLNPLAHVDLEIYYRMRDGFKEEVRQLRTHIRTQPPRSAIRHNKKMRKIARGG